MDKSKQYYKQLGGLALIVIGVVLLGVCYLFHWQSNVELLIGLVLVVLGYLLHVKLLKS